MTNSAGDYIMALAAQEMGGGMWEHSSAGRALALQARGHRFEPCCSHHKYGAVVQLVRMPACHAGGRGFEPLPGRQKPTSANAPVGFYFFTILFYFSITFLFILFAVVFSNSLSRITTSDTFLYAGKSLHASMMSFFTFSLRSILPKAAV